MHALGDPADLETALAARQHVTERGGSSSSSSSSGGSGNAALIERIDTLEARITELEERLALLEG
jgi:phage shock protein A